MINILHVDDSHIDLELIKYRLQSITRDFNIIEADSADTALNLIKEQHFDCILSDFQMPGTNGMELLDILHSKGIDIPFIFLTGQGNEEIAANALRAGAADYYTKETGFAEYDRLVNAVRRIVRANRISRERQKAALTLENKENELKEMNILLESVFDSIPDVIGIHDIDHTILHYNKAGYDFLGKNREEINGRKCHELNIENLPCSLCNNGEVIQSKKPLRREIYLENKDTWIEAGSFPVFNGKGDLVKVLEIIRDISNAKTAEEELNKIALEYEALYKLGQKIATNLHFDKVLETALEGIHVTIGPDLSLIFMRDGSNLKLRKSKLELSDLAHEETPVHKVGECLCGIAAKQNQPVYSIDISSDPRCTWSECKKAGVKSFAAIPLVNNENFIGILGLASKSTRDFSKQSKFIEMLATQISIGADIALNYQKKSE